jgi:hypothetical protein
MSDTPWWEVYRSLGFMAGQRQEQTLQAWAALFEAEGRDNADLVQVAYAIAKREKIPSFAEEHLEAIRQELRKLDAARQERQPVVRNHAPCQFCGDTGVVCGLPHSRYITAAGFWTAIVGGPHYTQCAKCDRCAVGKAARTGDMCTLTQYEMRNPYWQHQLDSWPVYAEAKRAADQATMADPASKHPESSSVRQSIQKLLDRIQKHLERK